MSPLKTPLLTLLATTAFFLTQSLSSAQSWANPAGGNLHLWGEPNRLNWGDHNPVDVLEELRLRCLSQTCNSGVLEIDTQVVEDEVQTRKGITVTVPESSFKEAGVADGSSMVEALKGLMSFEPWRVSSLQHWKSGTEGGSCVNAMDNFCWIANVEEGDLVQYMGPKVLDARWDDPNGNIQSHIKAVIDVVDIPADPWDCQKIVDTAEQIAGFITEIPGVAFFLASLLCGGSPF